jgi:hypothetical protein
MINQSVEPCWGIIETDVLLLYESGASLRTGFNVQKVEPHKCSPYPPAVHVHLDGSISLPETSSIIYELAAVRINFNRTL